MPIHCRFSQHQPDTNGQIRNGTRDVRRRLVGAETGEIERADEITGECEQLLLASGANPLLALVQLVRGRSLLAAGRHREAFEELRRIFRADGAAVPAVGRRLGRLRPSRGRSTERDGEPGSRAAAATGTQLEQAASSDLSTWPFTQARLLLAQGAWLRRHGQVAASWAPLRVARNSFEGLGARPWAERAVQELRASGESPRPRSINLRLELTAQELQIAQGAAEGLTNREIGQEAVSLASHHRHPRRGCHNRGRRPRPCRSSGLHCGVRAGHGRVGQHAHRGPAARRTGAADLAAERRILVPRPGKVPRVLRR
jgi:hypothetical protein